MFDIRFKPKRGRIRQTTPEVAAYARSIAANNSAEHDRLRRNLHRAIREELSPRQREVLTMYYVRNLTLTEIAGELHLNPSTVCRTLHRGEAHLRRCLRYGAQDYLMSMEEET